MKGRGRTRIWVLCVLLAGMLFLSGCVRFRLEITVDRSGKADVSILYAVSEEEYQSIWEEAGAAQYPEDLYGEGREDPFAEIREVMEEKGWTCTDYQDGSYLGLVWSRESIPLKRLRKMLAGSMELGFTGIPRPDDLEISEDQGLYSLSWYVSGDPAAEENLEDFEESGGFMEVVLHLPRKPEEHNATSVSDDGKTLTWDLLRMDRRTMTADFRLSGVLPDDTRTNEDSRPRPVLPDSGILVAAGAALAMVACVLFFTMRKKKGTSGKP